MNRSLLVLYSDSRICNPQKHFLSNDDGKRCRVID
jgi:hypothetical protein